MIIEFEGQRHEFPDDFSDAEISTALSSVHPAPTLQSGDVAGGLNAGIPPDLIAPFTAKLGRFASNVAANPPPSVAGLMSLPQRFGEEANKVARGENPDIPTLAEGAALGSPLPAAMRMGRAPAMVERPTRPEPVTAERLATERTGNYKAAADANLEVSAPVMHDAYNDALAKLVQREPGLEQRAPTTWRILQDAIKETAPAKQPETISPLQHVMGYKVAETKPVTGDKIRNTIKELGDVRPTPLDATDAAFAKMAKADIDRVVQGLPPDAAVGGNLPAFQKALMDARANNAAMERMGVLEAADERMAQGATAKQAFKPLARPPLSGKPSILQKEGFTKPEQAAVKEIGSPGAGRMALEALGNTAPFGGSWIHNALVAPAHVGAAFASSGATLPLTAAGLIARPIAGRLANNAVGRAMELTASRSPLARREAERFARDRAAYLAATRGARKALGGGVLPFALPDASQGLRQLLPLGRQ